MKKFLVLYKASQSGFEQMMKTTPEQQKAGMDAWMAWSKKVGSAIVDMGGPVGKTTKVTPAGASPSRNAIGGYGVMRAESAEHLARQMEGHPHFMMPDAFIEIVELVPIPGM